MLQSNKFIIHEEYNFDTYDNDIALIILKEKVELNNHIKIIHLGKDGFCYGDSGAPLLFNGSQIGLVSGGDKLCNKSVPTVFTNVAYYLLWIQENIIEDDLMDYDYQMGQPVRNEDYYVDDYDL
ncbi:Trypsin domain containing protein [Asbolus verrucosus]|uniref:Trypsin domain containing protein n=1 Tax=Asbolus verrucosus TaxID=1661398 RepID=A0A482W068_ASBVE|nr:Trypsin domain containing protein [Asbolus verrucosus]